MDLKKKRKSIYYGIQNIGGFSALIKSEIRIETFEYNFRYENLK